MMDECDQLEEALFATLRAAEYRLPYAPLPRWPVYDEEPNYIEVRTFGGEVSYIPGEPHP